LVSDNVVQQAQQMFINIAHVAEAAGGSLSSIVKLTIYLTSMSDFQAVNQVMQDVCESPYPARACIAVKELPKGASVEADAILILAENK